MFYQVNSIMLLDLGSYMTFNIKMELNFHVFLPWRIILIDKHDVAVQTE
jgi:hypothetical protein